MIRLLSTKILAPETKQTLLNSGIELVDYAAITIHPLPFKTPTDPIPFCIVTSKNAARVVVEKNIVIDEFYCVGDKTAQFLIKKGYKVVEIGQNGTDLGQKLLKKHSNKAFTFYCGNLRRPELLAALNNNGVSVEEIHVYETQIMEKTFHQTFDGILFFSPSGVQSFLKLNRLERSTFAFCIGPTTAGEAKKYTDKIIMAERPSVEALIESVTAHFRNTDLWN